MYMKVFGQQTTTDISPGQNMPHLTGGMVILVPKNNEFPFLYKIIWLKILHNILIVFMQFLVKFFLKLQNNKISVVNPVVSIQFLLMICTIS